LKIGSKLTKSYKNSNLTLVTSSVFENILIVHERGYLIYCMSVWKEKKNSLPVRQIFGECCSFQIHFCTVA